MTITGRGMKSISGNHPIINKKFILDTFSDTQTALRMLLSKDVLGQWRLQTVLFDMDGVLFDSMKNHTLAWYRAISALGIPCERDEFYLYEGCTGAGTINRFFRRAFNREASEQEIKHIYDEKSRHFNLLPEAAPMPGAKQLLESVVGMGIVPVLVTGSGQISLLERLQREFPGVFSPRRMVTAFDVTHGKPHPEPYLKGLEKTGASASAAIVIENAPLGVQAAVAAGIFTIAANTGPIPSQMLHEAGANILLPGMPELLSFWQAATVKNTDDPCTVEE